MSGVQLRRYEIKPGELGEFAEAWRHLVPIRRRYGFSVLFAFANDAESEFVWAVSHDGDFEEAEHSYYEDAERDAVGARVSPHVAAIHVSMVREVPR
jgi:hypothetical protein